MIKTITVPQVGYDTRMYCNLVYTNVALPRVPAMPMHFHLVMPIGKLKEKFPLLIYVVGGGWRTSNPERHLPECVDFARQGFVVAAIEYRTTAYARFPAPIEDVKTAVRYFRKHSDQYHIDPNQIFMIGGSAGAYLTAMVAATGDTSVFRGTENLDTSDKIQGAICMYGVYDFKPYEEDMKQVGSEALPMQLFLPKNVPVTLEEASPVHYITKDCPPLLLLHGTSDHMVPYQQSVKLHDRMQSHGLESMLYLLENVDHADSAFGQPQIRDIIFDFLQSNTRKD